MPNEPVQLLLNAGVLRSPRELSTPVNNGTDFFAGNDQGFAAHRDALVAATKAIRRALQTSTVAGGVGYVKVIMQRDAIAKSHRPQKALFRGRWTPQVGTDGLGEPIFAVTPESLDKVLEALESAETTVTDRVHRETGVVSANPSRKRCEASAIDAISLWTEEDRRDFSAAEASAWLRRPGTGNTYIVQCFPVAAAADVPELVVRTRAADAELSRTLAAHSIRHAPLEGGRTNGKTLAVEVTPAVRQIDGPDVPVAQSAPAVLAAHQEVLQILGRSARVRSISLPPIVSAERNSATVLRDPAPTEVFTVPSGEISARVGIIDGGVGTNLDDWLGARWGTISGADRNTDHGTFISGLLIAGAALNPTFLHDQTHGCLIFDVDVLPDDPGNTGIPFAGYYPAGVPQFLDEIESAVETYRRDHGVRVFNLSINFTVPGNASRYGYTATRLDEIAQRHDVIFVISAGNLLQSDFRSEWHAQHDVALASLASDQLGFLAEPGESLHNISVSALNPPGMPGQVPLALARYSRRGPGLHGATKPDFAHVGGSGSPTPNGSHGLQSLNEAGLLVSGCGTSYAAPIVARRLADLDALIEGEVSREVLLAMMVHFAYTPGVFTHKSVRPLARDLIGFGVPITAEKMLQRDDSEITLVVSSMLRPGEDNKFEFSWPASLVDGGKCSGQARVTVVARPPIAYEHGDERIRANIDVRLQQRQKDGGFRSQLNPVNALPASDKLHKNERDLLKEAMKWQVVKSFETAKMSGRGPSSDWRFVVDYLERTDQPLPVDGVEYAAVITIADPHRRAPVFAEMRQHLNAIGIQTDDIRTSIRTRTTT